MIKTSPEEGNASAENIRIVWRIEMLERKTERINRRGEMRGNLLLLLVLQKMQLISSSLSRHRPPRPGLISLLRELCFAVARLVSSRKLKYKMRGEEAGSGRRLMSEQKTRAGVRELIQRRVGKEYRPGNK